VKALVETAAGVYTIDVEADEIDDFAAGASLEPPPPPQTGLPRVVAAAAAGSTVVVAVSAKPPLLVSHDAGTTWRESGRGLPSGNAVAVAADDPDRLLFCAGNRLYLSRDGGRFWGALTVELPEDAIAADWLEG
jgi:photosystem II stability/assembly factor-like uncharacterized protein